MRLSIVLLAALTTGCASAAVIASPGRDALWRQAHHAMRSDSVAVALAAFQRLAEEHPTTMEGHEASYFLGALRLEPGLPTFDPERAVQHLDRYIAADSAAGRIPRRPEARTLRTLAHQASLPCERRTGAFRCDPAVVVRTRVTGGDTVVVASGDAAEIARLRSQVAARDATIRQLREELQRIRDTLAPRP
jgi:hypothetical protein